MTPHIKPPADELISNAMLEPEGERLRSELADWLKRNKIVSVLLSTENHEVEIHVGGTLPPRMKTVLTRYGSIYVVNEGEKP